ncbi:MAG TPA: heme-binding protein [Caulobacteraceae bacterium]|nr:heme-binding protein [Caulobacteraceae bacterium]
MTQSLRILTSLAAGAILAIPAASLAQRAPPARGPAAALALEAAQTAVETCAANGYKVAASVIDSGGTLKVLFAGDGVSPMGVKSSTMKALASNKYKAPTSEIMTKAKSDTALSSELAADKTMMAMPGALPLIVGPDLIGSIGVGGAPAGDKDEACAKAGLAKVQSRLQ